MSRSESNDKRKQFRIEERAVLDNLNDWEPIGITTPDDEYDCQAHHLLSILHTDALQANLKDKIRDEIWNHFDLQDIPETEIETVAHKIWLWWNSI